MNPDESGSHDAKSDEDNLYESREYKELRNYLQSKETFDPNDATHLRVGKGPGCGKYCINKRSEQKKFMKIYIAACDRGYVPNLLERQCDKEVGPLMTDYDFTFDTDDIKIKNNDDEHKGRGYSLEIIKKLVKLLNGLIYKYFEVEKADIVAYVTEKDKPTFTKKKVDSGSDSDSKAKEKIAAKDGFHICYIIPLSKEQRFLIYDKAKEIAKEVDMFKDIPFTKSYDQVFDKSTVHTNGWMLYGSRKTIGEPPYSNPYELTHIYHYNLEEEPIKSFSFGELVERFSVRQFSEKFQLNTREDYLTDLEEATEKFADKKKKQKDEVVSNSHDNAKSSSVNKCKNSDKATEILMAKKLTQILSPDRARGRDDWIRVCWTLHSIDLSLFDDFINFSKKGGSAFDHDGCVKEWNNSKITGYTIASLHWWAQQDNSDVYYQIIWDSIDKRLINAESGCSTDLAKLLYELYKFRFKCVEIDGKHKGWFEYQGHRWVRIDGAYTLRREISDFIADKFLDLSMAYMSKNHGVKDKGEMEQNAKKSGLMQKLSMKLKDTPALNSIISECEYRFVDEKFKEKLNEKPNLIGFDNGVYDLDEGEFRSGMPDDNISLTTGYDWVDFKGNEPVFKELQDYFEKVIPNPNIRPFLLKQIASYTSGTMKDQKFSLWTGTGCHSGDTKILMYNGEVKYAKDIKIGDILMGDDSTPRRVGVLFGGTQDMYEVVLSDGSSYIGNANHRLALKSMYDGEIIFDDNSKTYIVVYHKMGECAPIKCEKYFKVSESSDELAFKYATKYLEKKKHKQGVIHMGMIIPVRIYDYLKLDENIKKHYRHFRNPIDFAQKQVIIDPYKMGLTLTTSTIPTQYKFNSVGIRAKLLAGILDNVGTLEDKHVTITIPHHGLMEDCVFLCRGLGFHVDIKTPEKIIITGNFRTIPTKVLKILFDECNVLHDLTYDFDINGIGKGQFYGFSVDKNQRYILQNCIVTYNSNGKTMLIDLIKSAFGDYQDILEHTVLTRKRGGSSNATPELADKQGKRFIVMQEPEEDDKLSVGFMKQLCGGDMIAVRALFKEQHKYKPQFKLVMVCNNLPDIPAQDEGTWRRVCVIPFEAEFVDGEPATKYQFKKDKSLEDKIKTWNVAFMWLLVKKYYPIYIKEGISKLNEPSEVKMKTNKYRHDNDIYSEFIDDMYVRTRNSVDTIPLNEFYSEFKNWYRDASNGEKCPARKLLVNYIERTGAHQVIDGKITGLKHKATLDNDIDKGKLSAKDLDSKKK